MEGIAWVCTTDMEFKMLFLGFRSHIGWGRRGEGGGQHGLNYSECMGIHLNAYIYSRLFFLETRSEELKPDFATFAKNQCFTNFQPPIVHQHYIRDDWWFWMGLREFHFGGST